MNQDKRDKYAKVLLNTYHSGLLKIVWNTSGFSIGIEISRRDLGNLIDNLIKLKEKINSIQKLGGVQMTELFVKDSEFFLPIYSNIHIKEKMNINLV